MLGEAVLRNETGIEFRVLKEFRSLQGVLRADGRDLLENGRFRELVFYFATPEEANLFLSVAAANIK